MITAKDTYVRARYLGKFVVTGRVESTLMQVGNESASHIVVLDEPITVNGEVRDRVRIEQKNILQMASSPLL